MMRRTRRPSNKAVLHVARRCLLCTPLPFAQPFTSIPHTLPALHTQVLHDGQRLYRRPGRHNRALPVNPIFAGESTKPPSSSLSSSQQQQNGADKGKAKLTLEASWMEADDTSTTIRPDLIKTKGAGSAATVSLNDCLACRYALPPAPLPMSPFLPLTTALCPWHIYMWS